MADEEKIAGAPAPEATPAPTPEAVADPSPPPEQLELVSPESPPPLPPRVVAKAPEPPPKPKGKDPVGARVDALQAQLESEVEAMQVARAEMEHIAQSRRDESRLQYLRTAGAIGSLSDENVLALAPDHDPSSAEGRALLDKWREANGGLFDRHGLTGVQVAEEVLGKVPSSEYGTFGPRLARKITADLFK